MGRSAKAGVRAASASTIEVDFYYRGERCKERLKLEPTSRNMKWAESLLGKIRVEIGKGTFDYAATFPNSRRARRFAPAAAALDTVEQHLWEWLRRKEPTLELHTRLDYAKAIRNVLAPAFGPTRLRELTRRQVKDWIADRPKLTAKRLNNVLSPLRQMLEEAAEDELLEANPLAGLKIKRRTAVKEKDDVDPFTPAELKLILAACEGEPQFRNMVATAIGSGLRWPSEVIALQWSDVDLEAGTLRVRAAVVCRQRKGPKTAAGNRVVQLAAIAIEALRRQRAHTLLKGGSVFENPNTAEAWTTGQVVGQHWNPALRRAGVRHRPGKQLRHTYASTMLSAGEPLRWVAHQLGHLDASVTARTYSRFIPSVLPDVGHKGEAAWN